MEQGGFARLAQLQRSWPTVAFGPTVGRQSHLLLRALCAAAPTNVDTRFVEGPPLSGITTQFLCWCSAKLYGRGKKVWLSDVGQRSLARVSKEARSVGSKNTTTSSRRARWKG